MSQSLASPVSAQTSQRQWKRKDNSSLEGRIWTATRCRNLLQPLISGLALLKEDSVRSTSPGIISGVLQTSTSPLPDPHKKTHGGRKRVGDSDECWRPARKRIRQTYSSRYKPKEHSFTTGQIIPRAPGIIQVRKPTPKPGEILVPTPFLCRTKAVTADLSQGAALDTTIVESLKAKLPRPSKPSCRINDEEVHSKLAESMRHIRYRTHTTRYKVYERIYDAFDVLLRSTSPEIDRVTTTVTKEEYGEGGRNLLYGTPHSRSLFAICLRKFPEYIQHEEMCAAIDAEPMGGISTQGPKSISAESYLNLESLGTSGSGWRHLRMICRAHGVLVVKDSISQGFIDISFASVLLMLCDYTSALDEAEGILAALLRSSRYPSPLSTASKFDENPSLQPLRILADRTAKTGKVSYYYRQLTELVTRGLLPIPWLATKAFSSVWTTVFRLLSNDPANQDAKLFITSILPIICAEYSPSASEAGGQSTIQDEMLSALQNTVRSILITLSTMSLLSGPCKNGIISLTENILVDISLLSLEIDRDWLALIAITHFFACCGTEQNADSQRLVQEVFCSDASGFSESQCAKEYLPTFICDVAHCLARGTSSKPFGHLKSLIRYMEALISADTLGCELVLRQIIRNCAFTFAQHQPEQEQEHFQYAQNFGRHWQNTAVRSRTSPSICQSPFDPEFRWEEGISEWVTATPGPKPGKDRWIRRSALSDKTDYNCCQKPCLKRTRRAINHPLGGRVFKSPCLFHNRSLYPPNPGARIDATMVPSQRVDANMTVERLRLHNSPQISPHFARYKQSRRGVNKLRKLEQDPLHSKQNWKLFSESDDELSIPNRNTLDRCSEKLADPKGSINRGKKGVNSSNDRFSISSDVRLSGDVMDELGL